MNLRAIELIFRFGNIFSLTPPPTKVKRNLTPHQKIRSTFVFIMLTIHIFYNTFVRRASYLRLGLTQLTIAALTTTTYCLHNLYSFIIMKNFKHHHWIKLLKYLRHTRCHKKKPKSYYLQFVVSQLVVLTVIIVGNGTSSYFFDISVVQGHIMVSTEMYLQLFDATVRCIILEMVLSRYQYQDLVLTQASPHKLKFHSYLKVLKRTKYDIFILKSAVDAYNDIFGWTTLVNIFTTSLRTLLNIDVFMQSDGTFSLNGAPGVTFYMFFQMTIIFMCWVRHFLNLKYFIKDFILVWHLYKHISVRFYIERI
jgi:hypothetical protein